MVPDPTRMKVTAAINRIILVTAFGWLASRAGAWAAGDSVDGASSVQPGTTITMANWQNYKAFMPETMQGLFAGKYSWKMPDDVEIEVGPTVIDPLPKNYLAATEKYASQVQLVELPDGGLSLANYHGGIPFPHPTEPHKGWKTLANLWYRYIPHLTVDSYGSGCSIDAGGNFNCQYYIGVKRQLAYNTDVDAPPEPAGPDARYFTEWFMTVEPEQDKYTTFLTVNYADRHARGGLRLPAVTAAVSGGLDRRALLAKCRDGRDVRGLSQRLRLQSDRNGRRLCRTA